MIIVSIVWQQKSSGNLVLQLAPSASHQARAMLSLLQRYSWKQFAIVTSHVAGYNDFIQAVGDAVSESSYKYVTSPLSVTRKPAFRFIYVHATGLST